MQSNTWIFSLAQAVNDSVASDLSQDFGAFQAQWKSHGTPVSGLIALHHQRFVVIQSKADESRPSGCSIDSLRRGVTAILQQHRLEWLEGGEVFYRDVAGDIKMVHFQQIETLIEEGILLPETIVFDHSLSNSDDLGLWEVPLNQTWMKRFLPSASKQKV